MPSASASSSSRTSTRRPARCHTRSRPLERERTGARRLALLRTSSRRLARVRAVSVSAALAATLAGALAGCGSSSAPGTTADPAVIVPATAVLYAGATVRPTGAQKTSALAAGAALTHQADPYLRLLAALQTPGSAPLNFDRDVAPWLGPHAGVFLTSLRVVGTLPAQLEHSLLGGSTSSGFAFGVTGAQGAIVLDTTNTAKARSFLNAEAAKAGAHSTVYRGVPFKLSAGGVAFGLVDRFVVIGSESGLHAVIETSAGASALAHSSGYSKLLAAASSNALAHIYTNPSASTDASSGEAGLSSLVHVLSGTREANISLLPSADSLTLDADTLASSASGGAGGLLAADPEGAQALNELPGESWLAVGLGHVGTTLGEDAQDIQALASLGGALGGGTPESSTGLSIGGLLGGLIAPLRVLGSSSPQARHDFASWMGSAGIFASGASLLELKAAVSITSNDPALSRAAVSELGAALSKAGGSVSPVSIPGTEAAVGARLNGLPVILDIAAGRASNGHTKFVLGIGEGSVETALNPPSTLATAASRTAAAASLGEGIQPSLIVNLPTFLSLLEGIGLAEDPSISKLVPLLRSATTVTGGGRELGDPVERFRVVVGLQPASG